jgi:hypothetical protein
MTSVRTLLSTLLVGAACITGLAACGGDENKVSDSSFVDQCKEGVDTNATAKAYSTDICTCAQDKLKAQGLGDKTPDDKGAQEAATKAIADCTREAITGN